MTRTWCRRGLSFADADPLTIPKGLTVTIECPVGGTVNVYSKKGRPFVAAGAVLRFVGCDVLTVESQAAARNAPPPLQYTADYFGTSMGKVSFKNSRMLMPSEVCLSSERAIPLAALAHALTRAPDRPTPHAHAAKIHCEYWQQSCMRMQHARCSAGHCMRGPPNAGASC
jgi:hypothetical protein